METTSREVHLQWCKERALFELKHGGIQDAVASMASDLRKHPQTENHSGIDIMVQMLMIGMLNEKNIEKFISDFNQRRNK